MQVPQAWKTKWALESLIPDTLGDVDNDTAILPNAVVSASTVSTVSSFGPPFRLATAHLRSARRYASWSWRTGSGANPWSS